MVEKDRQHICKFKCGDVVYAAEDKVLDKLAYEWWPSL